MKKFYNQYKTYNRGKQTRSFWLSLLQWLRLLVLSLTRIKDDLPGENLNRPRTQYPEKLISSDHIKTKKKKLTTMKPVKQLIRAGLMLLLVACASKGMAQGPYAKTGNDTVCVGMTKNYGIPADTGSVTYHWSVTPSLGTITPGATPNLISVTWTSVGTALLQVYETNSNGCDGDTVSIMVIVNPLNLKIINPSVCANQLPYVFNGVSYNTAGTFTDTI